MLRRGIPRAHAAKQHGVRTRLEIGDGDVPLVVAIKSAPDHRKHDAPSTGERLGPEVRFFAPCTVGHRHDFRCTATLHHPHDPLAEEVAIEVHVAIRSP